MRCFSPTLVHFVILISIANVLQSTETPKECPFKKDAKDRRGHMKPFGHHAKRWLRVESRYDEVSAEEFYSNYVRKSKPVVIRGGINDWPAVKNWPNLTYLGDRTHDTIMNADWRKIYKEHEFVHAHATRRHITMRKFIQRMNKENIYMDSPPTAPMLEDMMWPQLTNCPYFFSKMRAPSFFFNNGKSNTDIHIDGCETLFFQVSGMRLWLMTPPDNAQYMYSGELHFPPHMGISAVNQHKVNLTRFPKMAESVLYAAVVNPGDLVYVPEAWFHNVMARGNPNIATTIFFDSSDCEKIYSASNDEEYVVACDKHRRIFLPPNITCESKLPRGTTWMDISRKFGKMNSKLNPSKGHGSEAKYERRLKRAENSNMFSKALWDKSRLPRMAMDGDIQSIIELRPQSEESILQSRMKFFNLKMTDIKPLANHLQEFKVKRSLVYFMLTIPHEITGAGVEKTEKWLDEAMTEFGSYQVDKLDVVLMEVPPCVPSSEEDQDCERDSEMTDDRLAVWKMLEKKVETGSIHYIGVKDVSAKELQKLSKNAKQKISIVCLRFDPLYRQVRLRKAVTKLKTASIMVHSIIGSGWIRDGVSKENPFFSKQSALNPIFSETSSVHATVYEWAIRRGFFVIPEPAATYSVAEIGYDAVINLMYGSRWSNKLIGIDNLIIEPGRRHKEPNSEED